MKWLKYSQYLYLLAGVVFLISAVYKFFSKEAYIIQLFISVVLVIMFLIRRNFIKRIENRQKKQ